MDFGIFVVASAIAIATIGSTSVAVSAAAAMIRRTLNLLARTTRDAKALIGRSTWRWARNPNRPANSNRH
jgi:hypothetical protein